MFLVYLTKPLSVEEAKRRLIAFWKGEARAMERAFAARVDRARRLDKALLREGLISTRHVARLTAPLTSRQPRCAAAAGGGEDDVEVRRYAIPDNCTIVVNAQGKALVRLPRGW